MSRQKKCELLVEEILNILGKGIRLSPEVAHYIDSTYSHPSLQEIDRILKDPSDCERDSLVELIFFPDESIQVRLEDLLEDLCLGKKEEQAVGKLLLNKQRRTPVYFPNCATPLIVKMPSAAVGPFLSRLNITTKLDEALVAAIHKNVSQTAGTRIKVKLRNTRNIPSGPKCRFLVALFEKMRTTDDQLIECLELVLDILEDLGDSADIFSGLMSRKRLYFKSVLAAEKFEAKLEKTNMEILMLQGQRRPSIDKRDAIKKMALIDSVGLSVFGKTQPLERVAEGPKLDGHSRGDVLRKAVKLLS